MRTKDAYTGTVVKPEVEDFLRTTLILVAKDELKWDIAVVATKQPKRPVVEIFSSEIKEFSKFKLAKAFLRWARSHEGADFAPEEITQWTTLFELINKILK